MKFTEFLHTDEYDPYANHEFDFPLDVISFPEFNYARSYLEIDPLLGSPLLGHFQVSHSEMP